MTDLEELSTLDVVGALTPEERGEFERELATAPPEARAQLAELRDLMVTLVDTSLPADGPSLAVKTQLMSRIRTVSTPTPAGFSFRFTEDENWIPHVVPGIRMKLLAMNHARGYCTLLVDVAPGTRFPPHHHSGDEECYVLSGSLVACGRRMVAGDFHHADAGSDHGELFSEEGCRVLLVVPPEDYLPAQ